MASLADIAFLLLIFFLVTTTIDVDRGIGLSLPAKGEETEVRTKNITNLLINAQGEILLDNEVIAINEIARRIEQKIQENDRILAPRMAWTAPFHAAGRLVTGVMYRCIIVIARHKKRMTYAI